jgi:hypothetical protein
MGYGIGWRNKFNKKNMENLKSETTQDRRNRRLLTLTSHFNFDNYFPEDKKAELSELDQELMEKKFPLNPPVFKLEKKLDTERTSKTFKMRCIQVMARDDKGNLAINRKHTLDTFAIRMKNTVPETRDFNDTDVLIPYTFKDDTEQEQFCYLSTSIDDFEELCGQVTEKFTSRQVYNQ